MWQKFFGGGLAICARNADYRNHQAFAVQYGDFLERFQTIFNQETSFTCILGIVDYRTGATFFYRLTGKSVGIVVFAFQGKEYGPRHYLPSIGADMPVLSEKFKNLLRAVYVFHVIQDWVLSDKNQ